MNTCLRVLRVFFIAALQFCIFSAETSFSQTDPIRLSDGTIIQCSIPQKTFAVSATSIKAWIEANACAIRSFYGRFPVKKLQLILRPVANSNEISYGQAMPGNMPQITIYVGTNAPMSEFKDSWVLAHEMTHLGFPTLERKYHWLEEGMATYVEPIARVKTGLLPELDFWEEFYEKAPSAFQIDSKANTGLNGVRDFRRVYWGGAVFCLLADIEIRQKTNGKHSFQSALKHIFERHGSFNEDRDALEILRSADKFLGFQVLEPLFVKMGSTSFEPNLEKLWSDLGIARKGNTIEFKNEAPLAHIRQAICSPKTSACSVFFEKK